MIRKCILYCLGFVGLLNSGCNTNKDDLIPSVYVNFTINVMSDPEFPDLKNTGGHAYVKGGAYNNGILIFRYGDQFNAYDRTCTYDPGKGKVSVLPTNSYQVKCNTCNSEFALPFEGAVQKGPAQRPLKQYQTTFNSLSNILYVNN